MSTVSTGDALGRIVELQQKAQQQKEQFENAGTAYQQTLKEIGEIATESASEFSFGGRTENSSTVSIPVKKKGKRGRPAGSKNKKRGRPPKNKDESDSTDTILTPKKRGRPPKNKDESESGADNKMSLKEAVFDVLSRPDDWFDYLDDYEAGSTELKPAQIKNIIEAEGKWTTSSKNIGAQIATALSALREDKVVVRDNSKYSIVKGKTLD